MSVSRIFMGAVLSLFVSEALAAPQQTLLTQVAMMPEEFRAYFFNAPLSAKVTLDGKTLGDAMIMLTQNNQVRIIHFMNGTESDYGEGERQRWLKAFSGLVPLGTCDRDCPVGLMAVDYSLSDASLALIAVGTGNTRQNYWYTLPQEGDSGLMINNQFNASGSRDQGSLSWNGGLDAALNDWSLSSQFQHDQSRTSSQSTVSRHAVTSLYVQREYTQNFLRGGLFTPDSQGLLRQPYLTGGGLSTLVGMMSGSSDARLKETGTPSLYPVYVTANREGVAEVYRDGSLINSQPIVPGLQLLDTAALPTGIYEVEIRILEEGRETSRVTETINKPGAWRNPGQRWRYNLFAGSQQTLWNSDPNASSGDLAAGASLNWLMVPRATVGVALQKVGSERQVGGSLDWQVIDPVQFYGNIWHSSVTGYGFDSQGVWSHQKGNVALSHSRSWYRSQDDLYSTSSRPARDHSTTLSGSWRLNSENSVNSRLNWSSQNSGVGVDVGYNTRLSVMGHAVSWRLSGFDRPYGNKSTLRNRGVSLNASFALDGEGRSGNVSIGSRTDSSGSRDLYASASLTQDWGESSLIKSTTGTLTTDRYGAGLSTYNAFDTSLAAGNFWGQRSSQDGLLSGGINTGSLLALGQGQVVMSKLAARNHGGGAIVEVNSDDAQAQLMAYYPGGSQALHAGRNFIPVEAWKPGTIQLDFAGTEAPALKVEPEYLDYQHIPGGVSSYSVRVMKTVTVMGRLVDNHGQVLGGAHVINHAGRTMSESDGLFTLEMQESNPVLKVDHGSGTQCEIHLNPAVQKREDIIFAGNLICNDVTQVALAESKNAGKGI